MKALSRNGRSTEAPLAEVQYVINNKRNAALDDESLQHVRRYGDHLRATINWLRLSIQKGKGGSCAYYAPISGWSHPYPETSGYVITTLIDAAHHFQEPDLIEEAKGIGEWLLALQQPNGWWPSGLYRGSANLEPSVFNSAQIIDGMVSLAQATGDEIWGNGAGRAARWLANGLDDSGIWPLGNYRQGVNPSYYTQVAWPMLRCWGLTRENAIRDAAERVLDRIIALRTENGTISGWGFAPSKPAFTHTIAYTIRGCIESAYALDKWPKFGAPLEKALEYLARRAELTSGRLPGAYHEDWRPVDWYSCLTGNTQIALCLLRYEERAQDLRLVNAAAKLIDYVCSRQRLSGGQFATLGAVGGSSPLWGRYMFMRYPNWAAKYHADALMMLRNRLSRALQNE